MLFRHFQFGDPPGFVESPFGSVDPIRAARHVDVDQIGEDDRVAERLRPRAVLTVAALVLAEVLAVSSSVLVLDHLAAEVTAQGAQHPVGFADIVSKVKPAVIGVRVRVEGAQVQSLDKDLPFAPDSPGQDPKSHRFATALGSGFFISPDGYAVTNKHVVENGRNFEISTDDGKTYRAKLIGTDSKTDLALIKVEGSNDFPYVRLASAEPRVGDWVLAIGSRSPPRSPKASV